MSTATAPAVFDNPNPTVRHISPRFEVSRYSPPDDATNPGGPQNGRATSNDMWATGFTTRDGLTTIDAREIYDVIRSIHDPEHAHTLEELMILSEGCVQLHTSPSSTSVIIRVLFRPTVKHCSLATTIGLCIRTKISEYLMGVQGIKTEVLIEPGKHNQEDEINRQLNDKERVAAAIENPELMRMVHRLIEGE